MTGPTADELTAEHINALERAADVARTELARDHEERPGVGASREPAPAVDAALDELAAAYVATGVDEKRAWRAVTVWMLDKYSSCADALTAADEMPWRNS